MEIKNVSGVVLAGGRSRRMGTKKADLKLGGRTLAEIQVQKLRNLGIFADPSLCPRVTIQSKSV